MIASAFGFAVAARAGGDVPREAVAFLGAPRLHGQGVLRFLGLRIYEARLWAGMDFDREVWPERRFVLELRYARRVEGRLIAERSLVEMRRQADIAAPQAERWLDAMQRLIPDVEPGDRLSALHAPGAPVEVHANGAARGRIDDARFARLFFGIWLDPKTSEPALRRQLLALPAT